MNDKPCAHKYVKIENGKFVCLGCGEDRTPAMGEPKHTGNPSAHDVIKKILPRYTKFTGGHR
jgi:hypothetical protein